MIFVANVSAHYRWTSRARDIGTKEDQDAARSLIDQTGNYKMNKIITRSDMSARIAGYILILQSEKNHDSVERSKNEVERVASALIV